MVFRGQLDGRTTLASVKDTSVSLAVGSDWIAAWDLGGRLYSVWKSGHTYRRGLNGRVLHKWRADRPDPRGVSLAPRDASLAPRGASLTPRGASLPPPPAVPGLAGFGVTAPECSAKAGRACAGDLSPYDARIRVHVEGADAHALAEESSGMLRRALLDVVRSPSGWLDRTGRPPDARVVAFFERCARFDARASQDDAARFAEVFAPVGILPPDQYLSIVLQATEGCSFGTCTFCDLYHERYRVKAADEFERHAAAVRDYLGDSAILRGRSVFLGAANALAVPMPRLLEFFRTIEMVFGEIAGWKPALRGREVASGEPAPRGRPVHAFVDGFTGLHKSAADYAALGARGLRRVYVGLESGHDPLLAFVRKPATGREAGGVSAGVIVMAGLGGTRFADGHVADTTAAVNEMRLDAGDLLYFSDLVEVPGTAYPQLAAAEDVQPLALEARLAQVAAIRAGLVFPGAPPRVARYDVREFVY
jgi:hypothetical protein